MWNRLVIDNCSYLMKFSIVSEATFYLTDYKTIWCEEINVNDLVARFKELNPLCDNDFLSTTDIIEQIKTIVENTEPRLTAVLSKEDTKAILELKSKEIDFILKYSFFVIMGDPNLYFKEFTLPLLQTVKHLEFQQKRLMDLLEKKDKEILEHELEGGELSRKSLVTPKFDRSSFVNGAAKNLFLNIDTSLKYCNMLDSDIEISPNKDRLAANNRYTKAKNPNATVEKKLKTC